MTEMEANGIESPEMNLQIHGQVIVYMIAKRNQWERGSLSVNVGDIHVQSKIGPFLYIPYIKTNSNGWKT